MGSTGTGLAGRAFMTCSRLLLTLVVLAAHGSAGCLRSTMVRGDETLVVAPASASVARVVFMRDDDANITTSARIAELHIVDGQGRLQGDLALGTWFAVELPPGHHVFAAWQDAYGGTLYVSALAAELAAGRTYFVRTQGRGLYHLDLVRGPLPLTPQRASARRLDPAAASEWGRWFDGRVAAAVRTAEAKLASGDGSSLHPEDGFVLVGTAAR